MRPKRIWARCPERMVKMFTVGNCTVECVEDIDNWVVLEAARHYAARRANDMEAELAMAREALMKAEVTAGFGFVVTTMVEVGVPEETILRQARRVNDAKARIPDLQEAVDKNTDKMAFYSQLHAVILEMMEEDRLASSTD